MTIIATKIKIMIILIIAHPFWPSPSLYGCSTTSYYTLKIRIPIVDKLLQHESLCDHSWHALVIPTGYNYILRHKDSHPEVELIKFST